MIRQSRLEVVKRKLTISVGLRPTAIYFDLYYQWINGKWRLHGIGLTPRPIAAIQPEGAQN